MASKGRVPPPHLRLPHTGPSLVHPDAYSLAIRPPPSGFPPFEMLPPHEIVEQKLSAQRVEIEKLATENRRLAATHGTLRHDLAAANQELQLIHAHIADVKSEQEQQTRGIIEKMSIMEAELKSADPIKMDLEQARAEAQSLFTARQELISKVQQLTRDLQIAHSQAQQIPSLMSELDSLRQEYQHCRAAYDYEKKLYNDHLESLQVMEKNYMAMSREVEKLRSELTSSANFDPRIGGPGSGSAGHNGSVSMGNYPSGQNAYASAQNAYGVAKGQTPLLGGGSVAGASGGSAAVTGGNSPHVVAQSAPAGSGPTALDTSRGEPAYDPHRGHVGTGYDAQKGQSGASNDAQRGQNRPNYDGQRGPTSQSYDAHKGAGSTPPFEAQRGFGSDSQRGSGYDAPTGHVYDAQRPPAYVMQRGSGNDVQRGANYDMQKGPGYHAPPRGIGGPQGQASVNNAAGSGYESSVPRGKNPARR